MEWFALMTAPQRELKAAEALRDYGYHVYVPTVQKRYRISRRGTRKQLVALFPRYIFARYWIPWDHMNEESQLCIRDHDGNRMIIGPVTVCGRQEPIADAVIGKIAETAARLDMDVDQPSKPSLKVGDLGIMRSGPFEGKQGTIVAIEGQDAKVAMKIFNAVRVVRARVDKLEAA
jgi:transcription antitermination factor NusG